MAALPDLVFAQTSSIPQEDPSRECLGTQYADVLFSEFQRRYPHIPLNIDVSDITTTDQVKLRSFKETILHLKDSWSKSGDASSVQERLVQLGKQVFPSEISKLVQKLEYGQTLPTAKSSAEIELRLAEWLARQPDQSVAPHDFMIEALRLSNGSVIHAWASAWNLTRRNWETAAVRNYRALNTKFISLTGERHLWKGAAHYVVLPEKEWSQASAYVETRNRSELVHNTKRMKMVITKRGDEFSYLYHRIGVELFSMVVAKLTNTAAFGRIAGTAGAMGEFLKYTQTAGLESENKKRVNNDIRAAESGARFYELAAGKVEPPRFLGSPTAEAYLFRNTTKFGYRYQLRPGQPAHYYGSQVDPKFYSSAMSLDELSMRFEHATRLDSGILDSIILASTEEAERLHRGLIAYENAGAPNDKLNENIQSWLNGTVARPEYTDVKKDLVLDEVSNLDDARDVSPQFDFAEYEQWLVKRLNRVLGAASIRRSNEKKRALERLTPIPPAPPRSNIGESCRSLF